MNILEDDMSELHSDDSYLLRKAQMDLDKKTLEAKKAEQELDRLILDLEHRYGLLGTDGSIDPKTGNILPADTANAKTNGKVTPSVLDAITTS